MVGGGLRVWVARGALIPIVPFPLFVHSTFQLSGLRRTSSGCEQDSGKPCSTPRRATAGSPRPPLHTKSRAGSSTERAVQGASGWGVKCPLQTGGGSPGQKYLTSRPLLFQSPATVPTWLQESARQGQQGMPLTRCAHVSPQHRAPAGGGSAWRGPRGQREHTSALAWTPTRWKPNLARGACCRRDPGCWDPWLRWARWSFSRAGPGVWPAVLRFLTVSLLAFAEEEWIKKTPKMAVNLLHLAVSSSQAALPLLFSHKSWHWWGFRSLQTVTLLF